MPMTSTGSACSGRPLEQASCSGSGKAAQAGRHPPAATLRGRSLAAATSTGQCLHAGCGGTRVKNYIRKCWQATPRRHAARKAVGHPISRAVPAPA